MVSEMIPMKRGKQIEVVATVLSSFNHPVVLILVLISILSSFAGSTSLVILSPSYFQEPHQQLFFSLLIHLHLLVLEG